MSPTNAPDHLRIDVLHIPCNKLFGFLSVLLLLNWFLNRMVETFALYFSFAGPHRGHDRGHVRNPHRVVL